MTSWLGQLTQAAQSVAHEASKLQNELQAKAQSVAHTMVEGLASSSHPQHYEHAFAEGPLGFMLEGCRISEVEPGQQAANFGVCVGDSIHAVAGIEIPVPPPELSEAEANSKLKRMIGKLIKEQPRPVTLTFVSGRPTLAAEPITDSQKKRVDCEHILEESDGQKELATDVAPLLRQHREDPEIKLQSIESEDSQVVSELQPPEELAGDGWDMSLECFTEECLKSDGSSIDAIAGTVRGAGSSERDRIDIDQVGASVTSSPESGLHSEIPVGSPVSVPELKATLDEVEIHASNASDSLVDSSTMINIQVPSQGVDTSEDSAEASAESLRTEIVHDGCVEIVLDTNAGNDGDMFIAEQSSETDAHSRRTAKSMSSIVVEEVDVLRADTAGEKLFEDATQFVFLESEGSSTQVGQLHTLRLELESTKRELQLVEAQLQAIMADNRRKDSELAELRATLSSANNEVFTASDARDALEDKLRLLRATHVAESSALENQICDEASQLRILRDETRSEIMSTKDELRSERELRQADLMCSQQQYHDGVKAWEQKLQIQQRQHEVDLRALVEQCRLEEQRAVDACEHRVGASNARASMSFAELEDARQCIEQITMERMAACDKASALEIDLSRVRAEVVSTQSRHRSVEQHCERARTDLEKAESAIEKRNEYFTIAQSVLERRLDCLEEQLDHARGERNFAEQRAAILSEERDSVSAPTDQSDTKVYLEAKQMQEQLTVFQEEAVAADLRAVAAERAAKAATHAEEASARAACEELARVAQGALAKAAAADARAEKEADELSRLRQFDFVRLSDELCAAQTEASSHLQLVRTMKHRLAEQSEQITEQVEQHTHNVAHEAGGDSEAKRNIDEIRHNCHSNASTEPKEIQPEHAGREETAKLYERLDALEKRCLVQQKKLNERLTFSLPPEVKDIRNPLGMSHPVTGISQPTRPPWITFLRDVTQRLLDSDRWLLVFYLHLLALYVVVLSSSLLSGVRRGDELQMTLHEHDRNQSSF